MWRCLWRAHSKLVKQSGFGVNEDAMMESRHKLKVGQVLWWSASTSSVLGCGWPFSTTGLMLVRAASHDNIPWGRDWRETEFPTKKLSFSSKVCARTCIKKPFVTGYDPICCCSNCYSQPPEIFVQQNPQKALTNRVVVQGGTCDKRQQANLLFVSYEAFTPSSPFSLIYPQCSRTSSFTSWI